MYLNIIRLSLGINCEINDGMSQHVPPFGSHQCRAKNFTNMTWEDAWWYLDLDDFQSHIICRHVPLSLSEDALANILDVKNVN